MSILVTEHIFNPWQLLAEHESRFAQTGQHGAAAVFVGTMREQNEGDAVIEMFLEHYPAMTESYLQHLTQTAQQRWQLLDVLVVHRVGTIQPNQAIVITAAWSTHRAAALAACQFLIEHLKFNAPFWKKETLASGISRWVEKNTGVPPAALEDEKHNAVTRPVI